MDLDQSSDHKEVPFLRYEAVTEFVGAIIGRNNR